MQQRCLYSFSSFAAEFHRQFEGMATSIKSQEPQDSERSPVDSYAPENQANLSGRNKEPGIISKLNSNHQSGLRRRGHIDSLGHLRMFEAAKGKGARGDQLYWWLTIKIRPWKRIIILN
jgi:hypothetical protein